jgi:hypothetical protein
MAAKKGSIPQRATPKDLMALVRTPRGTPGRAEAFAELLEIHPRNLNRFLRTLALDEALDPSIRSKAVGALGRKATPSALEALRAAVTIEDATVARRAIERLGKIGEPSDLDILKSARTEVVATRRIIRTAQLFLSYRHGLGRYRHDAASRGFGASEETALVIETRPLTGKAAEDRRVRSETPGVIVGDAPPLEVVCGAHDYTLFLTSDASETGRLLESQSIPAIMVEQNVETGIYDPIFYLMADPIGRGRLRITGVRPSGFVAITGDAIVSDGRVDFDLKAAQSPFQPPFTARGTVDTTSGAFLFKAARVDKLLDPAQARRQKRPKPQAAPV